MIHPIRRYLRKLALEQQGASMVQYLVVIGLVALAGLAAFKAFGSSIFAASEGQGSTVVCLAEGQTGCASGGTIVPPSAPPAFGGGVPSPGNSPGANGGGSGSIASNDGPVCTGLSCPPGSKNCFVAGTLVATPSGDTAIEQLRSGDFVLSRDQATGVVSAKAILQTYVRQAPSLVDLRLIDVTGAEDTIRSTPEHRFWTLDRGWQEAGSLLVNEALLDVEGRELSVVSVTPLALEDTVYNFEVDETHTYFVGRNHALVHNPEGYYQQVWNPSTGQWEYKQIGQVPSGQGYSPGPVNTPLPPSPYMGNNRPLNQEEYDRTHGELLHSGRQLLGYHGSGKGGYDALSGGSAPRPSQFPPGQEMWNGFYTAPDHTYPHEYGYTAPADENTGRPLPPGGTLGVYARPTQGYYLGGGDLKDGANQYGNNPPWNSGRPYSLTGNDGTGAMETVNSHLQDPVFVPVSSVDRYGDVTSNFNPYKPLGHAQFGGNPNPGFGRPPPKPPYY